MLFNECVRVYLCCFSLFFIEINFSFFFVLLLKLFFRKSIITQLAIVITIVIIIRCNVIEMNNNNNNNSTGTITSKRTVKQFSSTSHFIKRIICLIVVKLTNDSLTEALDPKESVRQVVFFFNEHRLLADFHSDTHTGTSIIKISRKRKKISISNGKKKQVKRHDF